MKNIFFLFILLFISFSIKANDHYNYKKIEYNNYQNILNKHENGIYLNPFEKDKIFLLLFNKEDHDFLENLNTKYDSILSYAFFYTTVDGIFVAHIRDSKTNTHFNIFNFLLNSETGNFLSRIMKNELVGNYYSEIIFLHEIYHLNHNSNANYKKDEIKADLFASIVISKKYNLSQKEFKNLFSNFFYLRYNFLDDNFKNNTDIKNYYHTLKEKAHLNYNKIIQADSFYSINQKINEL